MSKRFGRNQKRALRQHVSELNIRLAVNESLLYEAESKVRLIERRLQVWICDFDRILGKYNAFAFTQAEKRVDDLEKQQQVYRDRKYEPLNPYDHAKWHAPGNRAYTTFEMVEMRMLLLTKHADKFTNMISYKLSDGYGQSAMVFSKDMIDMQAIAREDTIIYLAQQIARGLLTDYKT